MQLKKAVTKQGMMGKWVRRKRAVNHTKMQC